MISVICYSQTSRAVKNEKKTHAKTNLYIILHVQLQRAHDDAVKLTIKSVERLHILRKIFI